MTDETLPVADILAFTLISHIYFATTLPGVPRYQSEVFVLLSFSEILHRFV